MNLAEAAPHGELASTGFCLARLGEQYVVYQPAEGTWEVRGLKKGKRYHVEWYDAENARVVSEDDWLCTEPTHSFVPDKGAKVLFLDSQKRE